MRALLSRWEHLSPLVRVSLFLQTVAAANPSRSQVYPSHALVMTTMNRGHKAKVLVFHSISIELKSLMEFPLHIHHTNLSPCTFGSSCRRQTYEKILEETPHSQLTSPSLRCVQEISYLVLSCSWDGFTRLVISRQQSKLY